LRGKRDGRQGQSREEARDVHRALEPEDRRAAERHDVQVVKIKGEFVWHKHDETDDFFLVLAGRLTIQLRDRDIELGPGELFVVPRGVEHCPKADQETHVLLIEPKGTVNTGDAGGELTAAERTI
jgi:mannose-6-phosphate isomerase-like protein (cupin superfamily)